MVDVAVTQSGRGRDARRGRRIDHFIRSEEVGVVEDVEELGAELQSKSLGEMRVAYRGEIELCQAGAGE